jgi:hypothetical protein
MTDMDELLQRDARQWQAEFQPPELSAMVATATRPAPPRARWAWPILAAVLLLAVPLVTVARRQHRHSTVIRSVTSPAPLFTKLLGSVPWVQAVSQPDRRSVTVYVDIDRTPGLACIDELPVLRAGVAVTGSQVTIRVQAYLPPGYQIPTPQPGTVSGCTVMGHHPVPLLVPLPEPLGGRTLVDASNGKSLPVTQAVELPLVTVPPFGYTDAGISPVEGGMVERSYLKGSSLLALVRTQAGHPFYPTSQVEATGTVLGHPAKVSTVGQAQARIRCVTWSDDSYSWQLCSVGLEPAATLLPATELLTAANSIR